MFRHNWPFHLTGKLCRVSEVKSLSRVRLFVTPRTVAYQVPQSMEFSRKSTGVGCCFLLQGIFLTKDQASPSPALAGRFFTTVPPGKSRKTTDNTEKVIDKVQRTFMSYFRFSLWTALIIVFLFLLKSISLIKTTFSTYWRRWY